MPAERFSWTEPQLCSYDFKLSEKWFVYFDYTDHLTHRIKRKQFRANINSIKKIEDRLLQGNALVAYWKLQLKTGYNPFSENEDIAITRPTIIEALNSIMQLKEATCGDRAMQSYRYIIKLFKEWLTANHLQHIYLYEFNVGQARSYMDYLTLKKKYSGRTFNDHLSILSTFYNCFIDREWVTTNPFRKIKKLPVEIGRNIAYADKEKDLLKAYLYDNDRQMYYFTQFIYYCFIRRSELTRLRISNINWHDMTIIIPAKASKNKKQESVVIPDPFVSILKEMNLENLPPDWFIFGRYLKPGLVQYKNYNHISTRHNIIAKNMGIDTDKGLYSWKHSGACNLYRVLNGDIYSLMRQCRHSNILITQIYLKSLGLVDNAAIRHAKW